MEKVKYRRIQDIYFKWTENPPLISGIQPANEYINCTFIDCSFHPMPAGKVIFRGCIFIDCEGIWEQEISDNPDFHGCTTNLNLNRITYLREKHIAAYEKRQAKKS